MQACIIEWLEYDHYLLSMCRIIEVLLCLGMRHASWITTNNVEISTSIHTNFTVPLNLLEKKLHFSEQAYATHDHITFTVSIVCTYLSGSSIHHWWWEYGQDSAVWVQYSFLQHSVVLLDACLEGDVISLGPAAQRMKKQHRILVPTSQ